MADWVDQISVASNVSGGRTGNVGFGLANWCDFLSQCSNGFLESLIKIVTLICRTMQA